MSRVVSSVEECVDRIIEAVGPDLKVGAPLGLGKPVQLLNALYHRACQNPELSLHIYTALCLEAPKPGSHIGPILAEVYPAEEQVACCRASCGVILQVFVLRLLSRKMK